MRFGQIVKHLDVSRARVATSSEAALASRPFDKYYGLNRARDIKKIHKVFTLEAYSIDVIGGGQFQRGELIFQYNVTVGAPFTIDKNFRFVSDRGGVLCVKYRVGTTVYRYALYGNQEDLNLSTDILAFTPYNGQVIASNCCFEFWVSYLHPQALVYGLTDDLKISTSILVNPDYPEEIERVIEGPDVLTKDDIGVALPETLPYEQLNQIWLDNEGIYVGDNGIDPFLGSPYPPVNYQLSIVPALNQIQWTLPDLIINAEFEILTFPGPPLIITPIVYVRITNYDGGDTTAEQAGTTVTLVGGNFRFVDTATDAGKLIKWPGGATATVVTVTDSTHAEVALNEANGPDEFAYLHPNLVFELWTWKATIGQFVKVASSTAPTIYASHLINEDGQPTFQIHINLSAPILSDVPSYVKAVDGSFEISSDTFTTSINTAAFP